MKISLITNIPTPYRDTQFALMKKKYPSLVIYFTGDNRENRLWDTNKKDYYVFLKKVFSIGKFGQLNYGLLNIVKNNDVLVIGGYEQPSYMLLILLAKLYKVPTILMFDGVAPSRIASCKSSVKYLLKKFLIRNFSVIFGNGTVSKKYFTECFGVDENKIFNQFLSVDQARFKEHIDRKDAIKNSCREQHAVDLKSKVILYSGRFIERKRVLDLIDAIGLVVLSDYNINIKLLLIGDNNEASIALYKNRCKEKSVDCLFLGFIQKEELHQYYFCSDLLVLPSLDEPWGLVVNEAVYSQLPIVASNDVGSAMDLVEDGVNGYIFERENIEDLSEKIILTLNLDIDIKNNKCSELTEFWNFSASLEDLQKAIQYISIKKEIPYE